MTAPVAVAAVSPATIALTRRPDSDGSDDGNTNAPSYTFSSAALRKQRKQRKGGGKRGRSKLRSKKIITEQEASSRSRSVSSLPGSFGSMQQQKEQNHPVQPQSQPQSQPPSQAPPVAAIQITTTADASSDTTPTAALSPLAATESPCYEHQLDLSSDVRVRNTEKPWETDIWKEHKKSDRNLILRDGDNGDNGGGRSRLPRARSASRSALRRSRSMSVLGGRRSRSLSVSVHNSQLRRSKSERKVGVVSSSSSEDEDEDEDYTTTTAATTDGEPEPPSDASDNDTSINININIDNDDNSPLFLDESYEKYRQFLSKSDSSDGESSDDGEDDGHSDPENEHSCPVTARNQRRRKKHDRYFELQQQKQQNRNQAQEQTQEQAQTQTQTQTQAQAQAPGNNREHNSESSLSRSKSLLSEKKLRAAPSLDFSYRYSVAADELLLLDHSHSHSLNDSNQHPPPPRVEEETSLESPPVTEPTVTEDPNHNIDHERNVGNASGGETAETRLERDPDTAVATEPLASAQPTTTRSTALPPLTTGASASVSVSASPEEEHGQNVDGDMDAPAPLADEEPDIAVVSDDEDVAPEFVGDVDHRCCSSREDRAAYLPREKNDNTTASSSSSPNTAATIGTNASRSLDLDSDSSANPCADADVMAASVDAATSSPASPPLDALGETSPEEVGAEDCVTHTRESGTSSSGYESDHDDIYVENNLPCLEAPGNTVVASPLETKRASGIGLLREGRNNPPCFEAPGNTVVASPVKTSSEMSPLREGNEKEEVQEDLDRDDDRDHEDTLAKGKLPDETQDVAVLPRMPSDPESNNDIHNSGDEHNNEDSQVKGQPAEGAEETNLDVFTREEFPTILWTQEDNIIVDDDDDDDHADDHDEEEEKEERFAEIPWLELQVDRPIHQSNPITYNGNEPENGFDHRQAGGLRIYKEPENENENENGNESDSDRNDAEALVSNTAASDESDGGSEAEPPPRVRTGVDECNNLPVSEPASRSWFTRTNAHAMSASHEQAAFGSKSNPKNQNDPTLVASFRCKAQTGPGSQSTSIREEDSVPISPVHSEDDLDPCVPIRADDDMEWVVPVDSGEDEQNDDEKKEDVEDDDEFSWKFEPTQDDDNPNDSFQRLYAETITGDDTELDLVRTAAPCVVDDCCGDKDDGEYGSDHDDGCYSEDEYDDEEEERDFLALLYHIHMA